MIDVWIVGGLMAGAFVSPLYFLVMRWLSKPQRAAFFVLIGALLLAISVQIYNSSIAGHYLSPTGILSMFRPLSFLALTLGWFVCGLFHALASLGRAWVPQLPAARG
jgi:phosphoglycerol transferase MdoB-like AlkP superfamily enzyme